MDKIDELNKTVDFLIKELAYFRACAESQGFIGRQYEQNQKHIAYCEEKIIKELDEFKNK